jgi:hypothetical protein
MVKNYPSNLGCSVGLFLAIPALVAVYLTPFPPPTKFGLALGSLLISAVIYARVEWKKSHQWIEEHILPLMKQEGIQPLHMNKVLKGLSKDPGAPSKLHDFARSHAQKFKNRFA